jgi:cell division protease FtsH
MPQDKLSERNPPELPSTVPAPVSKRPMWLLVFVVVALLAQFWFGRPQAEGITYSQFEAELDRGNVLSAEIAPESRGVHGALRKEATIDGRKLSKFHAMLPYTDTAPLVVRLKAKDVQMDGSESGSPLTTVLFAVLPWLLIGGFWFFAMRRMRAGGAQALAFGKAKTGAVSPETPQITFDDVANVVEAKAELQEIVAFLKNPEHFQRLGGHLPKGVLLVGAPGTGKTLLARATAGEAGRPFLTISGSDFVELFVGVGAARVRDLFAQAKAHAPCIIFIDELDAVGRTRGVSAMGGAHEEREQALNQLLVEMDGFEPNVGIIVLSATNRPDVLDPALLRPGRFDRRIVVDLPDVKGREQILRMHARKVPLAPDVDLAMLARGCPGLSGADLANLVNEAALLAARHEKDQVDNQDFDEAKDKVTLGIERRSLVLTEAERRITAYHEAGHALVNLLIPCLDPVQKVTIVPRGQALGLTFALPDEDRHNYTKEYLLGKLAVAQGGRAAEALVFGPDKVTTGAAQDFAQATELARRMVIHYGMTDALGPIGVSSPPATSFLGPPFAMRSELSERTSECVDNEIRRLLQEATDRAHELLAHNLRLLKTLAEELLEHETLDRAMLATIVAKQKVAKVAAAPVEADTDATARPRAAPRKRPPAAHTAP